MADKYNSVFRPALFERKVCLVTGGGSGIGRCTAHELAALGAQTVLVGRNRSKLDLVAAEIREAGGATPAIRVCDIRDENAAEEAVQSVCVEFGGIDCLVNNAGGQYPSPLHSISKKGWEAVVSNNLTGGFLFSRESFLQSMQHRGGVIVNVIADMWQSMPGMAHSGAARAGMLNLTMTAALEWAPYGVRVNAVAPGVIASSGLETYPAEMKDRLAAHWRHVPMKRLGTESEVSAAIVFLLSPAAAFISGACIRVDGAEPNGRPAWSMPDHERSASFSGFQLESAPAYLALAKHAERYKASP